MPDNANYDLKRINWLCRRGMKELDLLMEYYFGKIFPNLDNKDKEVFCKLLEYQDPLILDLLFKRKVDADENINQLIDVLREIQVINKNSSD